VAVPPLQGYLRFLRLGMFAYVAEGLPGDAVQPFLMVNGQLPQAFADGQVDFDPRVLLKRLC
jgi:hypothetical protein